jgi:uncharacterized protein YxeA
MIMKKKTVVVAGLLIVLILVAGAVYVLVTQQSDKSDDEIKEMFDCNRVTADVRATDVYCDNPSLYREHLKENNVIGPNDSSRLQ